MRTLIYIYIIMATSLFAKEEKFEGYINTYKYHYNTPNYIYAIGQYENDLMTGPWSFYTDSTKTVKIASGSFMNGNGSKWIEIYFEKCDNGKKNLLHREYLKTKVKELMKK